ncbi:uncharacterized protein [Eurosta solidaginis]|uniref:uncharacterized protein n=1 Tax=Eurosta solidaginis TaxID=178769 RepID=UPI003530A706
MTTNHIEVTLEQMLQMALGAPEIKPINLSILHSFFDILLKKLDCQYEKVEIDGLDGACFQKILHNSRISLLPFQFDKIEAISNKLDKMANLKDHHAKLEKSFKAHLTHIRSCNNKNNDKYDFKNWEKYSASCESLCIKTSTSGINCKLLKNYNFIKKIKEFVEEPLIGPISDMRRRIESLHVEIIDYRRRLNEQCERLASIDVLACKIEQLSRVVAEEEQLFIQAMVELQDMIDGKMYKVVLPALKKYIQTETDKINYICKLLQSKPTCRAIKKSAAESSACLSCAGKLICTQRPIMIAAKRPAELKDEKKRKIVQACSRFGPCLPKNMEKQLLARLKVIDDATEETKISREMQQSCFKTSEEFKQIQGSDGVYYRKA